MKKILIVIILVLCSCSKKKSAEPVITPGKPVLQAPAANSTCTIGRVISITQSAVLFMWSSSANSDSYDLTIKNLLTGTTTTQTASTTQLEVTLSRNTPYSWYVTSKSSSTAETTQSDVFKFYNAGVAATNYAPFPADITAPAFGQTVNAVAGKVTLTWNGADVDNDIVGYDVYVGTSLTNMVAVTAGITATTFAATVTAGTTYYWKIVTKDSQANTSTSEIHQFTVN